jgi:hypothetical protein
MRALFGVVGLLVVVAIVGVLAKKQLTRWRRARIAPGVVAGAGAPSGTPQQQVQQFEQAVEGRHAAGAAPDARRHEVSRRGRARRRFMREALAQARLARPPPAKCRSARWWCTATGHRPRPQRGRSAQHDPTAHAEIRPARGGAGPGQLPARRLRAVRDAGALRDVQRRDAARAAGRVVFGAPTRRPAPPARCSTCSRSRA